MYLYPLDSNEQFLDIASVFLGSTLDIFLTIDDIEQTEKLPFQFEIGIVSVMHTNKNYINKKKFMNEIQKLYNEAQFKESISGSPVHNDFSVSDTSSVWVNMVKDFDIKLSGNKKCSLKLNKKIHASLFPTFIGKTIKCYYFVVLFITNNLNKNHEILKIPLFVSLPPKTNIIESKQLKNFETQDPFSIETHSLYSGKNVSFYENISTDVSGLLTFKIPEFYENKTLFSIASGDDIICYIKVNQSVLSRGDLLIGMIDFSKMYNHKLLECIKIEISLTYVENLDSSVSLNEEDQQIFCINTDFPFVEEVILNKVATEFYFTVPSYAHSTCVSKFISVNWIIQVKLYLKDLSNKTWGTSVCGLSGLSALFPEYLSQEVKVHSCEIPIIVLPNRLDV